MDRPQRIFDAVRKVITASGVIAGKTRRALDSTVLDDAVTRQDTVTMLVTQICRVRRLIPGLASVWVREHNLEGGRPPCDWQDPADMDRLVSELVDDANELVWAVQDRDLKLTEAQADAVALLALVAGQDVEPGERPGQWRIAQRTAPDRVISTVDPESRHTHKTAHAYRDGFKGHIAVEPDTGLVTDCELTPGTTSDGDAAPGLIAQEPAGTEVLGDCAYGTGELRDHLERTKMTATIKPPPLRPAVPGGFSLDDFEIDFEARTVACPAGIVVTLSTRRRASFGAHCRTCPLATRCTTATAGRVIAGRVIVLHPHHRHLAAARAQALTDDFQDIYRRWRPMVERSLAWLTRGTNRRLPYRGVERNALWWSHRCAAVNLQRLLNLALVVDADGDWAIT